MRLTRALALGGVLSVAAAGLVACSAEPADDEPTSINIAIPSGQFLPNFYPPDSPGLWFMVVQPVYEGLVRWNDEKGEYEPWLAESYEISDDGLTTSFTLREGVTFTDGEILDAEAFVEVFNAYVKEGYFAAVLTETAPVAKVTGEYTFDIETALPNYSDGILTMQLHFYSVVSPAAYADKEGLTSTPVGTGPYILDEIVPDVSAHYVRNPDYWNPDAFDFDEVTFTVFADRVAALNALKSGQVDAAEIDYGLAAEAEAAGFTLNLGPSGYNGIIIVDREGVNFAPTGDKRVRQALAMAFDREAIAEEVELGYGHVSSQPFAENWAPEYVEGGDDRYPYDPERARELLAEAGYPDGFTLSMPSGTARYGAIDYGPIVEQYLSEIGVTVEWVDYNPDDLPGMMSDATIPAFVSFDTFANSIGAFSLQINWGTQPVSDPVFTELIHDYEAGTPEEHVAAQPELAEYILDQAWLIPFSMPQVLWATRSDIVVEGTNVPTTLPRFEWFQLAD